MMKSLLERWLFHRIKWEKIKEGQQVLIKLRAYPFEEYEIIRRGITYLTEVPNKAWWPTLK
jgi:hypothetical protein